MSAMVAYMTPAQGVEPGLAPVKRNRTDENSSVRSYPNTRSTVTRQAHQIARWISRGCLAMGYLALVVALALALYGGHG